MATSLSIQNNALQIMRKNKTVVTAFLMNGFQMKGTIKSFDDFCIVFHADGKDSVIYKHAISTITPTSYIDLSPSN